MDIIKSRAQYRNTVKLCSLLSISGAVLALTLSMLAMRKPDIKYYATTRAGQDIPMHSLSSALVTQQYLLEWSSIAARKVLNLNFSNLQQQLEEFKLYFTDSGYQAFTDSLKGSGLYKDVESKHLVISVVAGQATVLSKGVTDGRLYWIVQVPVLETVQSASTAAPRKMMVNMKISRVPSLNSTQGIAISDFNITH